MNQLKPIFYNEKKGSAQCKSAVMLGGMRVEGTTKIKAKKKNNYELWLKNKCIIKEIFKSI